METVNTSIIVVSFNTRALLARCLRTIAATVSGLAYEVIVVDNASTDGSAELVAREFPWARLIRNAENAGFAAANNRAIRISRGRNLLLLNSDAFLEPGTVERMAGFLDTHPGVGIVGAQLRNPDGTFQGSYADFPTLLGEVLLLTKLARFVYAPTYPSYPEAQSREARAVDWVSGACLMARRSAVDQVGLLDEDYFMYTEETDWCYRMRQAGWQVYYLPDARVVHHVSQSARKVPERRRSQVYRSKWLFMRKHYGWLTAAIFHLLLRCASAAKLLAWAAHGLIAGGAKRERARQNVRSYALLLRELGGDI